MKLALVITVKNERTLLRQNLEYHHKLGIDHAYVFLDDTEDNTVETIEDLPYVDIFHSVNPLLYKDCKDLSEFTKNYAEHHTARQMLNMYHAKQLACKSSYDWIIAIDADELICIDLQKTYPGQLHNFFKVIPDGVNHIRFSTLEVLQHRMTYKNVFLEETLFKAPDVKLNHRVFDPIHKKFLNIKGYYGQTKGKSAVRPSIPSKPKSTHKFVNLDGTALETIWHGFLLHYYAYDFNDFVKKFRNFKHRPNYYIIGSKVEDVKLLWRDLVNDPNMLKGELKEYYKRWVLFSHREVDILKRNRVLWVFPKSPGVIRVNSIKNLIEDNYKLND